MAESKKNTDNEAEIVLFGRKFDEKKDGGSDVGSGVVLIFMGIVFLLNSFEVVPWTIWMDIFRFWPVLLISAGLKMMFGNNVVSKFLLMIINIYLFGSLLGFLLSKYSPDMISWLPDGVLDYILFWEYIKK